MRVDIRRRAANLRDWLRWRQAYRWSVKSWFIPGDLEASRMVLNSFRPSRVLKPSLVLAPENRKLLVLAPHPDDEIIGPGGSLALARDSGCDISVLYLTTGRTGECDIRRQEALSVCRDAGFESMFAGYDADAIDAKGAALTLSVLLARHRFDCLFLPFFLDDHDDHRRANEVLLEASRALKVDAYLPREVWAYHVYGPGPMNCVVDISAAAERKKDLIAQYASQMAGRDWSHFSLGMNAVLSRFLPGGPEARYAEGFMVLPAEDYIALARQAFACGLYQNGVADPGWSDGR